MHTNSFQFAHVDSRLAGGAKITGGLAAVVPFWNRPAVLVDLLGPHNDTNSRGCCCCCCGWPCDAFCCCCCSSSFTSQWLTSKTAGPLYPCRGGCSSASANRPGVTPWLPGHFLAAWSLLGCNTGIGLVHARASKQACQCCGASQDTKQLCRPTLWVKSRPPRCAAASTLLVPPLTTLRRTPASVRPAAHIA